MSSVKLSKNQFFVVFLLFLFWSRTFARFLGSIVYTLLPLFFREVGWLLLGLKESFFVLVLWFL